MPMVRGLSEQSRSGTGVRVPSLLVLHVRRGPAVPCNPHATATWFIRQAPPALPWLRAPPPRLGGLHERAHERLRPVRPPPRGAGGLFARRSTTRRAGLPAPGLLPTRRPQHRPTLLPYRGVR